MNQVLIRSTNEQASLDRKSSIEARGFTQYTVSTNFIMAKNPFPKATGVRPSDDPWNEFEAFRQAHEIRKIGSWPVGLTVCGKEDVMLIAYPKETRINYPQPRNATFLVLGALYIGKKNLPANTIKNAN